MVILLGGIEREQWAIVLLRLVLSSVFILHGGQKVFGWLGGSGLQSFGNWLATLGVPAWLGYIAAYSELLGGIMVGLGVATEVAALFLAIDMLVAMFLVHWKHGYFIQNDGCEYALNLAILCIALMLSGPGVWYLWDPWQR